MTTSSPEPRSMTIGELIARLEEMSQGEPCHLTFDGDGTLWSGDISDDVFLCACDSEWFLESVRPTVRQLMLDLNLDDGGTVGQLLLRLFAAEKLGKLPEWQLFEIMTWCYAGRSMAELSAFARRVLAERDITSRIRWQFEPLLDWARERRHSCWLVTASPWPIVRVVADQLGFDEPHTIAARATEALPGVVGMAMAAPVPYGEQKLAQWAARRRSNNRLLAAFGDSPFDFQLLAAADLAVAVSPKPKLEGQLAALNQAVVLML